MPVKALYLIVECFINTSLLYSHSYPFNFYIEHLIDSLEVDELSDN